MLDDDKSSWYKIGEVAGRLNVGNHVIRHYTDKLEGVFGENIRVDPTNNFTMYNSEAIKILANVKKMVQEDHMNLGEVHKELTKVGQENLPAKFELDAAQSFVYIKTVVEAQQEQIGQLVKVVGFFASKMDGFEQLPSVLKSYHDDVTGVFKQISNMEQNLSVINDLTEKLVKSEQDKDEMRQVIFDLKERADRTDLMLKERADQTDLMIKQEVAGSVKSIIDDNEKRWSTLMVPEKPAVPDKRKWWKIFG